MPAKKNRREPNAEADFSAHAKEHQDAFGWAEQALALREAGRMKAAQAAERKSKQALRKTLEIEKRYPL